MSNQQVVEESIKKELVPEAIKVTEGDIDQIKKAAFYFTTEVQRIYEDAIRNLGLIQRQSFRNGRQILYNYMRQNANFTRDILQLQHYFEAQLDNFLGRTIYFTWVDKRSGNILYLDEVETGQVYGKASRASHGSGVGSIKGTAVMSTVRAHSSENINITQIITSATNTMEQTLRQKLQDSQRKRKFVYLNAVLRTNQPRSGNRFWWRPSNQRRRTYTIPFNGTGRIAQGYVDAVVNEDSNVEAYSEGDALENSLKYLYLNHIEIENIEGIIKGDVVMQSNGNIQFAVKTGDFNTASFGPAYILATQIQRGNFLDKKDLQNKLPELVKTEQAALNILQGIYVEVEKQLNSQLIDNNKI